MTKSSVTLSTHDIQRLQPLVSSAPRTRHLPKHLSSLREKLCDCTEVPPIGIPPFIVTMNSQVLIQDMVTGHESTCTLVFPRDANGMDDRVSVLSPIGCALFGARVGDVIVVPMPMTSRRYTVKRLVFQPESVGRYDL